MNCSTTTGVDSQSMRTNTWEDSHGIEGCARRREVAVRAEFSFSKSDLEQKERVKICTKMNNYTDLI